jgi:hypothetical protein
MAALTLPRVAATRYLREKLDFAGTKMWEDKCKQEHDSQNGVSTAKVPLNRMMFVSPSVGSAL